MCKSRKLGGKRCFVHSSGTLGTVLQTVVTTGEKESVVKDIMKSLRKEGSKLDAPSAEQVAAFAALQKFQVKHDESIPEHEKKIISNRWDRAVTESPEGGDFHAWKHTTGETMRRMRNKVAVFGAIGAMSLSVAGCGGDISAPNDTTSPVSPSPSASASVDPTVSVGAGFAEGAEVNDGIGDYRQLALAPDSPLLTYNAAVVDSSALGIYSAEQIADAQKTVSAFTVSEGLDSILAYNTTVENEAKWYAANSDKFSATALPDVQAALAKDTDSTVVSDNSGSWRGMPTYDGSSRIKNPTITLDSVTATTDAQSVTFAYSVSYNRQVINAGDKTDTKIYTETNTNSMKYSTSLQSDGTWKLTGWSNSFSGKVN